MAKIGFTRFKGYKKSGAMGYVPEKVYEDPAWPFKDGEVVKIRIEDGRVIHEKAQWWELLDWTKLADAYEKLPEEIRSEIQKQKSRDS
jgi:hypothetical protein